MMFEYCKLEIFIPESHLKLLRETLIQCDAGHIGNYDACMSYSHVIGTWRPLNGTKPYIGTEGAISEEPEIKAEVTCRVSDVDAIIAAVKKIHPYEEPVINAIPLMRTGM
ncbi:MAG: divalent cation tolerance protein CutA [Synergistaceae bacterium]|nr:divalent cation tolerance protein CutA [Synergistaceae bacterium]MBR0251056.1 divalent cation tolerance protein CutA [Synergistaceae bacterium]